MPTYDYYCRNCDEYTSEFVHNIDDPVHCPVCKQRMQRLFSPTRALFVAEPFRDENVDTLRKWKHELERKPARRKQAERAAQIARELNASAGEWEKLDERVERFRRGELDE